MNSVKYLEEKYNIIVNAYHYFMGKAHISTEWLAIRKQPEEAVYMIDEMAGYNEAVLKADSVELTPELLKDIQNCWAKIFVVGNKELREITREEWCKEQNRFYDMQKRCYNTSNKDYKYYGACGVRIFDDWLDNPFYFYAFAISNGSIANSIDKITPKGDYEPRNIRFVNWKQNVTENKINVSQYPPKPRFFKGIGRIYQQDYELKILNAKHIGLVKSRQRRGWTLFEALNVKVQLTPYPIKEFWQEVENGTIKPLWEVFLNDNDERAVYFDKLGDIIECPKCNQKSLELSTSYKVQCKCGVEVKLKSV